MSGRVSLMGVPLDMVGFDEAVERVTRRIESGEGGLVVTLNPEMVMIAQRDAGLRDTLRRAALVVPDGVGIVWAARRLGHPLPGRVPGIELMESLLAKAEDRAWAVYCLGARPETLRRAVAAMSARFPGLKVAGARDGYFAPGEGKAVAQAIRASGARLLFMAMGVPREQRFWADEAALLNGIVAVGVGGSFDVWGGAARRAPGWMRRANVEWLYRLIREPSRWRRQRALPYFALRVIAETWRNRREDD